MRSLEWGTAPDERWLFAEDPADGEPEGRADSGAVPYIELHCHSAYSFMDGVTHPSGLVTEALRLGLTGLAVTDHDGLYGAVQLAQAARGTGLLTVFGAELGLTAASARTGVPDPEGEHLLVLARGAEGYRRLSAAIGEAHLRGGEKGRPSYDLEELAAAASGHWVVLSGCRKGAVRRSLAAHGPGAAVDELARLAGLFGSANVYAELHTRFSPGDDRIDDAIAAAAAVVGLPVITTGNVHFATPSDGRLANVLAARRARKSLDAMEAWLPAHGTAHLRSGQEMARIFRRFPGAVERTVVLGRELAFEHREVGPRLPPFKTPDGTDEPVYLRRLTMEGAAERYGTPAAHPDAYRQLEYEREVIEGLGFPGYFLIVHDIVRFCRANRILVQGRGSAANSAVCYALGITSVDPVGLRLVFERFLSPERDGPPDIDLDIEHKRREEAIQYVYDTYGRQHAAQVANVITYRAKMALRDAGAALGYAPGSIDAWSKQVSSWESLPSPAAAVRPSLDGEDAEIPAMLLEIAGQLEKLPRHLGVHSGGIVVTADPVSQVCPTEWARMPGRSVLQWDKEDVAAAGLVKIDLLGLGMLSALRDCLDLVAEAHGVDLELHTIPSEDPAVYAMLCDADSVGVFQVESRAQMATLPRLRPNSFYDLVVEIALIRPGPIQGGSVHPYIRRRQGREPADIPHPLMEGALARTLGVPLFQEQMMQLAIDCAGFSATEADQLRQAMSAKRAPERVARLRGRMLSGMLERGISQDLAEEIFDKVRAFSSTGFPSRMPNRSRCSSMPAPG